MAALVHKARALALAAILPLGACGPAPPERLADSLLSGSRAPISPAQLGRAATAAHRFAAAYARSVYRAHPPKLPGASAQATATLRAAAARVPPGRRQLEARAGRLRLEPESPTRVAAQLTIRDGSSPPFSVGFGLSRRGGRWRVTSISPPG